jgi:hypothetical protein
LTELPNPATEASAASEPPSLTLLLQQWIASLRNAAARLLTVAALEARLAALNFTLMLLVAVASGLLLASSWIALFAAIVAGLHALGLAWHFALLLVAVVNFALAIAGFYYINRMSNHLLFNTLRALVAEPEPTDANHTAGPTAGHPAPATPD